MSLTYMKEPIKPPISKRGTRHAPAHHLYDGQPTANWRRKTGFLSENPQCSICVRITIITDWRTVHRDPVAMGRVHVCYLNTAFVFTSFQVLPYIKKNAFLELSSVSSFLFRSGWAVWKVGWGRLSKAVIVIHRRPHGMFIFLPIPWICALCRQWRVSISDHHNVLW